MKKSRQWPLVFAFLICLLFSGCANKTAEEVPTVAVNSGDAEASPQTGMTQNAVSKTDEASEKKEDGNVLDLTKMSSAMIYGEVFDIMTNPDHYIGKTIKIRGQYYATHDADTGKYYHSVVIKDATACCSQGIEFVWDDGHHVYPDEYPSDGTEVEITGIFETYTEGGDTYGQLLTDKIVRVDS